MYKITELRLVRFGSHLDTKIDLSQDSVTMITGKNLDDKGLESNGSGKSHIYEAITKLVTNKSFKNVLKNDLIMDGEETSIISGDFKDSRGDEFTITREISRKGSGSIVIRENGVERTDVVDKDGWILEKIGINYEDFVNYFVIGQKNKFSIFEAGDAYLKKLISRYTNTSFLDKIISDLKLEIKDKKEQYIRDVEAIPTLENEIEFLESQKEKLIEDYKKDLEEQIEAIVDKIPTLEKSIKELKKKKKDFQVKIDSKEEDLIKLESIDLSDKQKQLDEVIKELKKQKTILSGIEDNVDSYKRTLRGEIHCPKCEHGFIPGESKVDLGEIKKQLKKEELTLSNKESEIDVLEKSKQKLSSKLNELRLQKENKEHLEEQIEDYKDLMKECKSNIKKYKVNISEKEDLILELKNRLKKPIIKDIPQISRNEKKIKENNETIKNKQETVKEIEEEIQMYEFWEVSFGNKGFKTFLVNKTLGVIEGYTNYFLQKFKTDLRVEIEGFKENKNGDISEKVTTNILRGGELNGLYSKFSGGEKRRIDICGILAMRTIINNNLTENQGLDILGMDELFEGLDSIGQVEILDMLCELKIPVLVTTHLPITSSVHLSNVLEIVKKGGISKINL